MTRVAPLVVVRNVPRALVITVVAAAAIWTASAGAAVTRVSFTSTVNANDYATLTVKVSPSARCTIKVVYDTTVSRARGLGAKTGATATWRWKVGSNTHPGSWPVIVDCGKSGRLALRLRVR